MNEAHGVQTSDQRVTLQRRFHESLHDAGASPAAKRGFMRTTVAGPGPCLDLWFRWSVALAAAPSSSAIASC